MFDFDEVLSAFRDGEFERNVHSETDDVKPPLPDRKESASFLAIIGFYDDWGWRMKGG
jgi:hypothetical protein